MPDMAVEAGNFHAGVSCCYCRHDNGHVTPACQAGSSERPMCGVSFMIPVLLCTKQQGKASSCLLPQQL
jgi:hypothetical protein